MRIYRALDDDRLLGGTNRSVIEALACEYVANSFRDVSRALDHRGHVPGADSNGGLARRIRRSHEPDSAGRQYHRSTFVLHQLLSAFDGGNSHATDCARGQP